MNNSLRKCFTNSHLRRGNSLLISSNRSGSRCLSSSRRWKSSINATPPSFSSSDIDQIYHRALDNANNFDSNYGYKHEPLTIHQSVGMLLQPMRPHRIGDGRNSNTKSSVPSYIARPPYAHNGHIPPPPHHVELQDQAGIDALRTSARLARKVLDKTCELAKPGVSTDEINTLVHEYIVDEGAYPSPLNYAGFPKSVCSSINEVVCHGIPDGYVLKRGDVASFDVSLFFNGYHGDNCATVLVGDGDADCDAEKDGNETLIFESKAEEELFVTGRRLIQATQEALDMAISTCRSGSCLSEIGAAVWAVSEAYGYDSVEKYRGHGIGRHFHCPPFVKHYRNHDYMELQENMVFTIEPMITEGRADCVEWQSDGWTVVTRDGGRSAQFEHMVAITSEGAEILTIPS